MTFNGISWDLQYPIGSMYAIYGNIYHPYTPNVSIYTIHGSYGYIIEHVIWPVPVQIEHPRPETVVNVRDEITFS